MNARSVWNLRALFALFVGASIIPAVVAQPAATSKEDETVKLEKFVVTGSLIPVAADSPAVPITILSAVDIAKSGVNTDILQVLKKTEPYFYGANNIGSDNGNISSGSTNGGSAVALRNRATLVLINGRRAAVAPVLASGGGNFVDVSLIPIAAVERIEILSDGASATYGSDAVSGVVNIILKTNYQGGEVSGRYGFSTAEGKYRERSYSGVFGAGNDKTNVTISTEWKKSDPLIQYQRPWARGQFRTPSFAGSINIGLDFYYLNPSTNAPPTTGLDLTPAQLVAGGTYAGPLTQGQVALNFDLAAYPTMLIKAQRRSVVAAVDHQLTDNIKLFGDFIYTVNNTESVLNAQPVAGNVAASHPFNPFNVTVTARNRFIRFPRIYQAESISTRGVVGMKGTIGSNWSYELAGDFNRTLQKFRNHNLIDAIKYTDLVNTNAYNPFARNQAAGVIESMLGTSFRDYVSELNAFDLRVTGEVFDLPGGPLQMGFGAETRWESLSFMNDRFDQTGQWLQATPRQPFNARSTTDGFFAEARIPVFDKGNAIDGAQLLEFSIAGRKDIYSRTADPFVPKYTVRWLPFNNEFAVRGTYSESFSAPTLYDLLGPTSVGFTASINVFRYDTSGNPLNVQTGSRQYRSRSGSNPRLNPSESRNWTAGFVWSPTKSKLKGLEISADWFDIDERDLISSISSSTIVSSVERLGPASPYASLVRLAPSLAGETHFDDGAPITTPGQMTNRPSDEVWISNQLVNVAGVWQSGADIRVRYNWDTESMGKFNAALSMVYLHNYHIQSLPGGTSFNYTDSFSGTSVYPRFRTYTTLGWNYKNWEAGLAHTFIPEIDDVANAVELPVKSYHNFDLQASYSFSGSNNKWLDGLSFAVGINNVLDEEPPFITSEGNQNHDINTYDPIGRFYWVSARYKF
jgi:iron complex outermembrane recepter protein